VACTPCAAGTYGTAAAATSALQCLPCAAGTYSYGGSTSCAACDASLGALASAALGCRPAFANAAPSQPLDAGFYLPGSAAEGVAAFSASASNTSAAALGFASGHLGSEAGALDFSAFSGGALLATPPGLSLGGVSAQLLSAMLPTAASVAAAAVANVSAVTVASGFRYVRITGAAALNTGTDILNFGELQLFDALGANVALNMSATLSSIWPGTSGETVPASCPGAMGTSYVASNGVDGNPCIFVATNVCGAFGTCWWQLDFGAMRSDVVSAAIWTRIDSLYGSQFAWRLNGAVVSFLDANLQAVSALPAVTLPANVASLPRPFAFAVAPTAAAVPVPVAAPNALTLSAWVNCPAWARPASPAGFRFVRVTSALSDSLDIAELMLFNAQGENVAFKSTATQTSTFTPTNADCAGSGLPLFVPSAAVDGNPCTYSGTTSAAGNWWMADLNATRTDVTSGAIYFRTQLAASRSRLNGAVIAFLNANMTVLSSVKLPSNLDSLPRPYYFEISGPSSTTVPATVLALGAPAAPIAPSVSIACVWSAVAANNASTGCANGNSPPTCDSFGSLPEAQLACAALPSCLAVTLQASGAFSLRAGSPGASTVAAGQRSWYLLPSSAPASAACRGAALQTQPLAANSPCTWAVQTGQMSAATCANGQSVLADCDAYVSLAAAQTACAAQASCQALTLLAGLFSLRGSQTLSVVAGATTILLSASALCRAPGLQALSLQVAPAAWLTPPSLSPLPALAAGAFVGGAAFVGVCDNTWHHLALSVSPDTGDVTSTFTFGAVVPLSQGMPCAQSSTYPSYPCTNAVDGRLSTFQLTNSYGPTEWLSVDLGAPSSVTNVVVIARQDYAVPDRSDGFRVYVGSSGGAMTAAAGGANYALNPTCPGGPFVLSTITSTAASKQGLGFVPFAILIPCPLIGRFVTIAVPRAAYFQLAEVQVFGALGATLQAYTAFFDGRQVAQGLQAYVLPALTTAVLVGAAGGGGTNASSALALAPVLPFGGRVDDARIYARALAPAEVLALAGPPFPPTPNFTVTPPRIAGATSYTWTCRPGYVGPPTTLLVRTPADGAWNTSTGAAFACAVCTPAGSYCPGGASAVPCPPGSYASASGTVATTFANTCSPCPAGTYSAGAGAVGASSCLACPAGSTSPEFSTSCAAPSGLLFDNTFGLRRFRADYLTTGVAAPPVGPLSAAPWALANVLAAPFALDAAVDSVTVLLVFKGSGSWWVGSASLSLWDTAVGTLLPTPTALAVNPVSGATAPVVTAPLLNLTFGVPTAVTFNISRAWLLAGGAQYAFAVSTSDTTSSVVLLYAAPQTQAPLAFGNSSLVFVAGATQTTATAWTALVASSTFAMVVRGVPAPIARAAVDSTLPARALAGGALVGAPLAPSVAVPFLVTNATALARMRFRVFASQAATYSVTAQLYLASASGAPRRAVAAAATLTASFTSAAATTAYDANFTVPSGGAAGAWPSLAAGRAYAVVLTDAGATGRVSLLLAAGQPAAQVSGSAAAAAAGNVLTLLPALSSSGSAGGGGAAWPAPAATLAAAAVNLSYASAILHAAGNLNVLLDNAEGLSAVGGGLGGYDLPQEVNGAGAGAALVFSVPHRSIVAEVTTIQVALTCSDSAVSGATTWRYFDVAAMLYEATGAAPLPALAAEAPAVSDAVGIVACLLNSNVPAVATLSARSANWPPLSGGHSYAISLTGNSSAFASTSTLTWLYSSAAGGAASAPGFGGLGPGGSGGSLAFVPLRFVAHASPSAPWAAVASAGGAMPALLLLNLGGFRSASQLALDTTLAGAATALLSPASLPPPLLLTLNGTGGAAVLANAGTMPAQLDNVTVWVVHGGTANNTGAAVALNLTMWAVNASGAPLAPLTHLQPIQTTVVFAPLPTSSVAATSASAGVMAFARLSVAAQAAAGLAVVPAAVPVVFSPAPGQVWPPVPPGGRFALVLSAAVLPVPGPAGLGATPAPFNAPLLSLWWDAALLPPADGLAWQPTDGAAVFSLLGASQQVSAPLPPPVPFVTAPAGAWSALSSAVLPALSVRATPVTMPVYDTTQGGTRIGGRNQVHQLNLNPFSTSAGMAYLVLDTDPDVNVRLGTVSVWVSITTQSATAFTQQVCIDLVTVHPTTGSPTTTAVGAAYPEVCVQVSVGAQPASTWSSTYMNLGLATFTLDRPSANSWAQIAANSPYSPGPGFVWQDLPAGQRVALAFSAPLAASSTNVHMRFADPALAPSRANATASPLRLVQSLRSAANGVFIPVPDGFAVSIGLGGASPSAPTLPLVLPGATAATAGATFVGVVHLSNATAPLGGGGAVAVSFTVLPSAAHTVGNQNAAVALALPTALQPANVTVSLVAARPGLFGVTVRLWTADPFSGAPLTAVPPSIAPPVSAVAAVVNGSGPSLLSVQLPLAAWPLLAEDDSYALVVGCDASTAGSAPFASSSAGALDNACSGLSLRLAAAPLGPQVTLVSSATVELLPTWTTLASVNATALGSGWQPLAAAAANASSAAPPCAPGWTLTTSATCVRFFPQLLTQPLAQAHCAALGPGGGLASILNAADLFTITNLSATSASAWPAVWIGLQVTQAPSITAFFLRGGDPTFALSRFSPGAGALVGNPSGDGPAVQLLPSGVASASAWPSPGVLNDITPTTTTGFACELPAASSGAGAGALTALTALATQPLAGALLVDTMGAGASFALQPAGVILPTTAAGGGAAVTISVPPTLHSVAAAVLNVPLAPAPGYVGGWVAVTLQLFVAAPAAPGANATAGGAALAQPAAAVRGAPTALSVVFLPPYAPQPYAAGTAAAPVTLAAFNLTSLGWPDLSGRFAYSLSLSANASGAAAWLFSAPEAAAAGGVAAAAGRPNGGALAVLSLAVATDSEAGMWAPLASAAIAAGYLAGSAEASSVPALRLAGRAAAVDAASAAFPAALDTTAGLTTVADAGAAPFASLPQVRPLGSSGGTVAAVFTVAAGGAPLALHNVTVMLRVGGSPLPWAAATVTATAATYASIDYDFTLQAFLYTTDPATGAPLAPLAALAGTPFCSSALTGGTPAVRPGPHPNVCGSGWGSVLLGAGATEAAGAAIAVALTPLLAQPSQPAYLAPGQTYALVLDGTYVPAGLDVRWAAASGGGSAAAGFAAADGAAATVLGWSGAPGVPPTVAKLTISSVVYSGAPKVQPLAPADAATPWSAPAPLVSATVAGQVLLPALQLRAAPVTVVLDNTALGTRIGPCRDFQLLNTFPNAFASLVAASMAMLVFDSDPLAAVQLDSVTVPFSPDLNSITTVRLSLNVVLPGTAVPDPFSYVRGFAPVAVTVDLTNGAVLGAPLPGSPGQLRLVTFRVRDVWPAVPAGQRFALGVSGDAETFMRAPLCGDGSALATNGRPGAFTPVNSWWQTTSVALTMLQSSESFGFLVLAANRSAATAADWSAPPPAAALAAAGAASAVLRKLPAAGAPFGSAAAVFMTNGSFAAQLRTLSASVSANASGTYVLALSLWTASAASGLPLAPVAGAAAPATATLVVTPSAVGAPRLLAFAMPTLGGLAWPALLPATTYALVGSVLGASGAGSDASGAGAGAVSWALAAPQLSQCPPGWSLTTSGSCWQLAPPTQLLTQPASQAYCAGLGAGGGLATPQNQADWLLLLNLSTATPTLRTQLWTGLMVPPATRAVPSTFYLMRNYSNATAAFAATRFAASSPTGVGPCVQMNGGAIGAASDPGRFFSDISCTDTNAAVCELTAAAGQFQSLDLAGQLQPLGGAVASSAVAAGGAATPPAAWSALSPGGGSGLTLALRATMGPRLLALADSTLGGADVGGAGRGGVAVPASGTGAGLAAVVSLPLATAQAALRLVSVPVLVQPPSGAAGPFWLAFQLSLLPAAGASSAAAGARALPLAPSVPQPGLPAPAIATALFAGAAQVGAQAVPVLVTFDLAAARWPVLLGGAHYALALSVNDSSAGAQWGFASPAAAAAGLGAVADPTGAGHGALLYHGLAALAGAGAAAWAPAGGDAPVALLAFGELNASSSFVDSVLLDTAARGVSWLPAGALARSDGDAGGLPVGLSGWVGVGGLAGYPVGPSSSVTLHNGGASAVLVRRLRVWVTTNNSQLLDRGHVSPFLEARLHSALGPYTAGVPGAPGVPVATAVVLRSASWPFPAAPFGPGAPAVPIDLAVNQNGLSSGWVLQPGASYVVTLNAELDQLVGGLASNFNVMDVRLAMAPPGAAGTAGAGAGGSAPLVATAGATTATRGGAWASTLHFPDYVDPSGLLAVDAAATPTVPAVMAFGRVLAPATIAGDSTAGLQRWLSPASKVGQAIETVEKYTAAGAFLVFQTPLAPVQLDSILLPVPFTWTDGLHGCKIWLRRITQPNEGGFPYYPDSGLLLPQYPPVQTIYWAGPEDSFSSAPVASPVRVQEFSVRSAWGALPENATLALQFFCGVSTNVAIAGYAYPLLADATNYNAGIGPLQLLNSTVSGNAAYNHPGSPGSDNPMPLALLATAAAPLSRVWLAVTAPASGAPLAPAQLPLGSATGGVALAVAADLRFAVQLQGVTLAVLSTGARELGLQPVSLRLWAANATSGLPTAPVATAAALTAYVYVTPAVALLNASANASAALQLTFGAAALAAWPALQPGRTYALVLNASATSGLALATAAPTPLWVPNPVATSPLLTYPIAVRNQRLTLRYEAYVAQSSAAACQAFCATKLISVCNAWNFCPLPGSPDAGGGALPTPPCPAPGQCNWGLATGELFFAWGWLGAGPWMLATNATASAPGGGGPVALGMAGVSTGGAALAGGGASWFAAAVITGGMPLTIQAATAEAVAGTGMAAAAAAILAGPGAFPFSTASLARGAAGSGAGAGAGGAGALAVVLSQGQAASSVAVDRVSLLLTAPGAAAGAPVWLNISFALWVVDPSTQLPLRPASPALAAPLWAVFVHPGVANASDAAAANAGKLPTTTFFATLETLGAWPPLQQGLYALVMAANGSCALGLSPGGAEGADPAASAGPFGVLGFYAGLSGCTVAATGAPAAIGATGTACAWQAAAPGGALPSLQVLGRTARAPSPADGCCAPLLDLMGGGLAVAEGAPSLQTRVPLGPLALGMAVSVVFTPDASAPVQLGGVTLALAVNSSAPYSVSVSLYAVGALSRGPTFAIAQQAMQGRPFYFVGGVAAAGAPTLVTLTAPFGGFPLLSGSGPFALVIESSDAFGNVSLCLADPGFASALSAQTASGSLAPAPGAAAAFSLVGMSVQTQPAAVWGALDTARAPAVALFGAPVAVLADTTSLQTQYVGPTASANNPTPAFPVGASFQTVRSNLGSALGFAVTFATGSTPAEIGAISIMVQANIDLGFNYAYLPAVFDLWLQTTRPFSSGTFSNPSNVNFFPASSGILSRLTAQARVLCGDACRTPPFARTLTLTLPPGAGWVMPPNSIATLQIVGTATVNIGGGPFFYFSVPGQGSGQPHRGAAAPFTLLGSADAQDWATTRTDWLPAVTILARGGIAGAALGAGPLPSGGGRALAAGLLTTSRLNQNADAPGLPLAALLTPPVAPLLPFQNLSAWNFRADASPAAAATSMQVLKASTSTSIGCAFSPTPLPSLAQPFNVSFVLTMLVAGDGVAVVIASRAASLDLGCGAAGAGLGLFGIAGGAAAAGLIYPPACAFGDGRWRIGLTASALSTAQAAAAPASNATNDLAGVVIAAMLSYSGSVLRLSTAGGSVSLAVNLTTAVGSSPVGFLGFTAGGGAGCVGRGGFAISNVSVVYPQAAAAAPALPAAPTLSSSNAKLAALVFTTSANGSLSLTSVALALGALARGVSTLSLALWTADAATGLPVAPVASAAAALTTVRADPAVSASLTATFFVGGAATVAAATLSGGAASVQWPALLPAATYALVATVASGEAGLLAWSLAPLAPPQAGFDAFPVQPTGFIVGSPAGGWERPSSAALGAFAGVAFVRGVAGVAMLYDNTASGCVLGGLGPFVQAGVGGAFAVPLALPGTGALVLQQLLLYVTSSAPGTFVLTAELWAASGALGWLPTAPLQGAGSVRAVVSFAPSAVGAPAIAAFDFRGAAALPALGAGHFAFVVTSNDTQWQLRALRAAQTAPIDDDHVYGLSFGQTDNATSGSFLARAGAPGGVAWLAGGSSPPGAVGRAAADFTPAPGVQGGFSSPLAPAAFGAPGLHVPALVVQNGDSTWARVVSGALEAPAELWAAQAKGLTLVDPLPAVSLVGLWL
jgi:hypothetical protein